MLHRKAEIQNSFSSYFLEIGDMANAEEQSREAQRLYESYYNGESHPLLGHILWQKGSIEKEKGNVNQAMELFRQAKAIFIHFHGDDNLFTAQLEEVIAEVGYSK